MRTARNLKSRSVYFCKVNLCLGLKDDLHLSGGDSSESNLSGIYDSPDDCENGHETREQKEVFIGTKVPAPSPRGFNKGLDTHVVTAMPRRASALFTKIFSIKNRLL